METSDLLKRVRQIEIKTRGLSNNIFAGQYHSAFKGKGMSFSEVREYQYGDDVRDIDWNVTARYNKPFVKVSAGFGSVKLSWEAVEGAEKYAVYKINDGRAVKLTETTKLSVRISTSEDGIYGVKAYVNGKWTTLTTSDLVKAKAE